MRFYATACFGDLLDKRALASDLAPERIQRAAPSLLDVLRQLPQPRARISLPNRRFHAEHSDRNGLGVQQKPVAATPCTDHGYRRAYRRLRARFKAVERLDLHAIRVSCWCDESDALWSCRIAAET